MAASEEELVGRIERALLRLGPHAVAAVRVLGLPDGRVLYERNPDLSLTPASNMKLFTSAVALAKLGPDYRFTTRVLARGERRGQTLHGDLILQGGGDPTLETDDLEALADAVRLAGIRRVTGRLLVDDTRYDSRRLGAGWNSGDEPYYYSAQISALSVDRNVVRLDIRPGGAAGEPAHVQVRPVEGYVRIVERPTTGPAGSETRIDVNRERGRNDVRVTGSIALDAPSREGVPVTVEDPARFAGALFRELLARRGVRVRGEVELGVAPPSATVVGDRLSPPLAEIVALLNKPSDNLIAEMLLKELGFVCRGSGDARSGAEVVVAWLREMGIDTGGVRIHDGSGLSRLNLVTARAVSELLLRAERCPWRDAFVASLPVAGADGTLRSRMQGSAAQGKVVAKTGTLMHVTSLSGYAAAANGRRLVFSILVNNYPGPSTGPAGAKRIEDLIAIALAEHEPE